MKIQKCTKNTVPKFLVILSLFLVGCNTTTTNITPDASVPSSSTKDMVISNVQNGTILWETAYPSIISISEHMQNLYLLCKNKIVVLKNDGTYLKESPIIYEENLELVDGIFLWDLNEVYCTFHVNDTSSTLSICYDLTNGQKKFQFPDFDALSSFQMTTHDLCISDDTDVMELGKINAYNRLNGELMWEVANGTYIISKVWSQEYTFCTFSSQADEHTMYISSIRNADGTVMDKQILSSEGVSTWPDYITCMCMQENTLYVTCVNENNTVLKKYNVLNDGKLELLTSISVENEGIENHSSVYIDKIFINNATLYLMTMPADYSGLSESKFLFHQVELQKYLIREDRLEYVKSQELFKTSDDIEGNIIDDVYISNSKDTVFIDYHLIEKDNTQLYQTLNIHKDGSVKTDNQMIEDVSSVKHVNGTLFVVSYEKDKNRVSIHSINSDGNSYQYPIKLTENNYPPKQYYGWGNELKFIDIVPLDNGTILLVVANKKVFCFQ
jgi:hypothetical protein